MNNNENQARKLRKLRQNKMGHSFYGLDYRDSN